MLNNIKFISIETIKKRIFTSRIMKNACYICFAVLVIGALALRSNLFLLFSLIALILGLAYDIRDNINSLRMEIRNLDTLIRLRK